MKELNNAEPLLIDSPRIIRPKPPAKPVSFQETLGIGNQATSSRLPPLAPTRRITLSKFQKRDTGGLLQGNIHRKPLPALEENIAVNSTTLGSSDAVLEQTNGAIMGMSAEHCSMPIRSVASRTRCHKFDDFVPASKLTTWDTDEAVSTRSSLHSRLTSVSASAATTVSLIRGLGHNARAKVMTRKTW
jgi:hypothetical protein